MKTFPGATWQGSGNLICKIHDPQDIVGSNLHEEFKKKNSNILRTHAIQSASTAFRQKKTS